MSRGVLDHMVMRNIVNNCKDSNGYVDIPRAISIARAKGYTDFADSVKIRKFAEIENSKNKR